MIIPRSRLLDLACPGRWEIASVEVGDLACFVVKPTSEFPSGQAYMAWTADGSANRAIAARPDPFIGALHATIEKLRIR